MTNRITQNDLYEIIHRLNKRLNATLDLDWAYGKVRVIERNPETTGIRDISWRGTKREIFDWLQAFETGLNYRPTEPEYLQER